MLRKIFFLIIAEWEENHHVLSADFILGIELDIVHIISNLLFLKLSHFNV